jgi:hypothetical protein
VQTDKSKKQKAKADGGFLIYLAAFFDAEKIILCFKIAIYLKRDGDRYFLIIFSESYFSTFFNYSFYERTKFFSFH